jgi:hypothetical protein
MQTCCCNNIIFSTSFYELDYIIKEKETPDDNITIKEIKSKILA